MSATEKFIAARRLLLDSRIDYEKAYCEFRWPLEFWLNDFE